MVRRRCASRQQCLELACPDDAWAPCLVSNDSCILEPRNPSVNVASPFSNLSWLRQFMRRVWTKTVYHQLRARLLILVVYCDIVSQA